VQRNYIKRKMREFFRLNQGLLKTDRRYDIWVVIKRRFSRGEVPAVQKTFTDSLKRLD